MCAVAAARARGVGGDGGRARDAAFDFAPRPRPGGRDGVARANIFRPLRFKMFQHPRRRCRRRARPRAWLLLGAWRGVRGHERMKTDVPIFGKEFSAA